MNLDPMEELFSSINTVYTELIPLVKENLLDQTISKNALEILESTVNDLKKNDIETFKTRFFEIIKRHSKNDSIENTKKSLKLSNLVLEQLKEAPRAKFEKYVETTAE